MCSVWVLTIWTMCLLWTVPADNRLRPTLAKWRNSTEGIHAFLTFDSEANDNIILNSPVADRIDYVWGSSESQVKVWRASSNPKVVLSKYIPYTRDPSPHTARTPGNGLPWWQQNKPELVLYQCDRKTPAWECFPGEGCSHVSVPLDLTNPATLDYQMVVGVEPAIKAGYNAIAFDNYAITNQWSACGAYRGPGGAWVQIYNASDPKADRQYSLDVLDWTRRAVDRIHQQGLIALRTLHLNPQCLKSSPHGKASS